MDNEYPIPCLKQLLSKRKCLKATNGATEEKRTELFLSCLKSSFEMKVKFTFHLKIKVLGFRRTAESHKTHVARSPV